MCFPHDAYVTSVKSTNIPPVQELLFLVTNMLVHDFQAWSSLLGSPRAAICLPEFTKNKRLVSCKDSGYKSWRPCKKLDVCLSVHRFICVEKKNQLDATEWFIALIKCSTCFGHFYAHHQELETTCFTTAYGVQCLVAGCRARDDGHKSARNTLSIL